MQINKAGVEQLEKLKEKWVNQRLPVAKACQWESLHQSGQPMIKINQCQCESFQNGCTGLVVQGSDFLQEMTAFAKEHQLALKLQTACIGIMLKKQTLVCSIDRNGQVLDLMISGVN